MVQPENKKKKKKFMEIRNSIMLLLCIVELGEDKLVGIRTAAILTA